jgi:phage gp29-like protein
MALSDWLPWRSRAAAVSADLPKLPGGAPVGSVYQPRSTVSTTDPLEVEANAVRTLTNAARSADSGYLGALNAIMTGALVRDARLAGAARTRTLAISSRRWAVRPPVGFEQDREAVMVAQSIAQVFYETPSFAKRRAELGQGILRMAAVLEHDWIVDKNGWRVSRPRLIDADRVDCNVATGAFVVGDSGPFQGRPLSDWQDKFIVHSPASGLALPPQKRGALRPLLPLALAKRFGLRWWLENLERFGQSQIYVKGSSSTSTTLLDEWVEGLRNLTSQWAGAFRGEGVEIDALPVSFNDAAHQKFCDYVNTEYAVNLLGGNLTSEVKDGNVFGSQAQDRVRGDILAADLVELDETIVDQWIEPTVRFNRPGAPVPVIETVVSQQRPWQLTEYQAGLCTLDEYRTSNGADALGDARGAAFYAAPQAPTYAQGTQVLSIPHPLSLPSGGADAGAPFPRSTTLTSPTSPTRASGPARLLSQS